MQATRSRGLQAAQQGIACSSRHANSRAGDSYKLICNFFLRQERVIRTRPYSTVGRTLQDEHRSFMFSKRAGGPYGLLPCITQASGSFRSFRSTLVRLQKPSDPKDAPRKNGDREQQTRRKDQDESKLTKHDDPSRYAYLENYSQFFRRLAMSLPGMPTQRPTRDDLLNVATNFWQRLRIRFKWFTIKSFRKFNADDISAFLTWFIMSQTVWILVGTTTFFSVVFATLNSLRLQEYVARAISDYLTSETGVTIIFESAIVPKWKGSKIAFKNVFISRRPPSMSEERSHDPNAGHLAAARYDYGNHPANHGLDEDHLASLPPGPEPEERIDYAMFDLNVDSVDVTLSLTRWLDGKGLIESAAVKGVRGILDRRFIYYEPDTVYDPADFRHPTRPGDFELESLQVEDLLVTVYQPDDFRPCTFSIFRADIGTFRKQWLFYDILSADNIVGQFDNCLFSLHKPQSIGRTTEQDVRDGKWTRMARFRIDGVNIDHVQRASAMEGPISWITSGKFDAVFDFRFPAEEETDINALIGELADAITTAASAQAANLLDRIPGQRELAKPAISPPEAVIDERKDIEQVQKIMTVDLDLRFRDLKASVPLFTKDLTYVNNALIRPIVAFINANKTLVPIHCRIIKNLEDFDGAWTMWETGLMDEISLQVYEALAFHVTQANFDRRVKTVGLWSLQKTIEAALSAMKTVMQPMSVYLEELQNAETLVEWGNLPT